MASSQAYLKPANKKGLCPIAVRYINNKGKWFAVAVGESIQPDLFDKQRGRVKSTHPNYKQINSKIERLIFSLMEASTYLQTTNEEPTQDKILAILRRAPNSNHDKYFKSANTQPKGNPSIENSITVSADDDEIYAEDLVPVTEFDEDEPYIKTIPVLNGTEVIGKIQFIDWEAMGFDAGRKVDSEVKHKEEKPLSKQQSIKTFEDYLDEFVEVKSLSNKGTAKITQSWANQLKEFSRVTETPLHFHEMKEKVYNKYARYYLHTLNCNDNYFGSRVKKLKTFLKWCQDEHDVLVSRQYKKFRVWTEEKEIVYLSPGEIDQLWQYKPRKACNRKYIDLCVFGCLTGLRYIDIKKPHFRIHNGLLTGKCDKNAGTYKVPLLLDARIEEILQIYGYNLDLVSDVKYNEAIKEILKEMYEDLGLETETVEVIKTKLGKKQSPMYFKKWELISSHSNRRSFVCNAFASGFSQRQILEMLGSSSLKELEKYLRIEGTSLIETTRLLKMKK